MKKGAGSGFYAGLNLGKGVSDERGATLLEYSLMLMLVAVVCVSVVQVLGVDTSTMFSRVASGFGQN